MKDTVLRGTGNSRTLRTVANALTLYPTYNAMIQAMVNGTFPIDLGALNSAGLTTRGTDLNKSNILTDATATGMGLTSSATPNQAFAKLRALIKAAQDDADTALENGISFMTGSYAGTGTYGEDNPTIIRTPRKWRLMSIDARSIALQGAKLIFKFSGNGSLGTLSSGNAITTDQSISITDFNSASNQFNSSGKTYQWWAI